MSASTRCGRRNSSGFHRPRLGRLRGPGLDGFGFPAAVGARFANPDSLVFAIVGDGGFQMSITELATVQPYLPVKLSS